MSNTLVCDQLPVKLMPFPSASAALTTVIHSFPAIYPCPGCDGSRVGKVVKMNPSRARFSSSSWEGDPGWDIYSLQMFWIYLGVTYQLGLLGKLSKEATQRFSSSDAGITSRLAWSSSISMLTSMQISEHLRLSPVTWRKLILCIISFFPSPAHRWDLECRLTGKTKAMPSGSAPFHQDVPVQSPHYSWCHNNLQSQAKFYPHSWSRPWDTRMSSLWAATQVAVYHFLSENHGFRLEVQSLIPHASYLVENQLVSCRRSRSDGTKRTASSAKNREVIPWTRHSQDLCREYGWGFSRVFNLVHRLPVGRVQEFIQMHFPPFDQIPQSGLRVLLPCWT